MNVLPGRLYFLLRVAEYRHALFHVVDNARAPMFRAMG